MNTFKEDLNDYLKRYIGDEVYIGNGITYSIRHIADDIIQLVSEHIKCIKGIDLENGIYTRDQVELVQALTFRKVRDVIKQ